MNLNKINIETLINYDLNIGKELPLKLRLKFEDFFQADFSKVRIHEGFIAQEIGALALTSGSQILFALGNYCPDLKNGQRLIAHELTHVIQQREGRIPINHSERPYLLDDFELENEAERCADAFISGQKHANIKRNYTSCQSCAMVVQPAKVYLKNMPSSTGPLDKYWKDFERIQDILTTSTLFLPALKLLENELASGMKKGLSDILLKKERDNGINMYGAPIYIGVLAGEDDFAFKKHDERAMGKPNIAKDYVTPQHGDYTHRIHWYIIMCYCKDGALHTRYPLAQQPQELLKRTAWPSFAVPRHRWPDDKNPSMFEGEEDGLINLEAKRRIEIPNKGYIIGEYLWVALFDRLCERKNYTFLEDGITQPEVFTSLLIPEEFNINGKATLSQSRVERQAEPNGELYNYSKNFPKLSDYILKRYIKRTI